MKSLHFKRLEPNNTLDRKVMSLLSRMVSSDKDAILDDAHGEDVYVVFNKEVKNFSDLNDLDLFQDECLPVDLTLLSDEPLVFDDKIVGFFSVSLLDDCLGLYKIYVAENHREKGFGFEIMDYVFYLMDSYNYKELILKKEGSFGFWEKIKSGYKRKYNIKDDGDSICFMVKKTQDR